MVRPRGISHQGFLGFFSFLSSPLPSFLPLRQKNKSPPAESTGPPFPGANGPGTGTGERWTNPKPGAGSQGGGGRRLGQFFLELFPGGGGERAAPAARGGGGRCSLGAEQNVEHGGCSGRGKTTPKIGFFGKQSPFPGLTSPRRLVQSIPSASRCISYYFSVGRASLTLRFAPHRMFPPGSRKGWVSLLYITLRPNLPDLPPKHPGMEP